MRLNEQIEAAWKEFRSKNGMRVSCQDFAEIYRAAMRSLYVEVKPENMKPGETYMMLLDGVWIERQCVTVEYLRQLAWMSGRVYRLSIPSPSDIFGEEG